MLNSLKKNTTQSKNFVFILIFNLIFITFLGYALITLISIILPIIFELLYTLSTQLFYLIIPVSILISSLLVILLPNPIYALIALILVFLNTAIFLLSIKVQFLALIYLIVYIGAISILFLFVIMLFNLRSLQKSDLKIKDFSFLTISFKFYFFFGLKFFLILALDIWNLVEYTTYFHKEAVYNQFDLQYFLTYVHWDILLFGNLFYTYYSYIFLLSGLVLLAAMIGSIVLALSTTEKLQLHERSNSDEKSNETDFSIPPGTKISQNGISFDPGLFWHKLLFALYQNGYYVLGLNYHPKLATIARHVDDFSNKGRQPLGIAEEAKAIDASLAVVNTGKAIKLPDDEILAKHGYRLMLTEPALDHINNRLVVFVYEQSLTNPKERGLYHKFRTSKLPRYYAVTSRVAKIAGWRTDWFSGIADKAAWKKEQERKKRGYP